MINPIKQIYDFNEKAGLLEKGYDDFLESSFQIEEALEGFTDNGLLQDELGIEDDASPKEIARVIVAKTHEDDNGKVKSHNLSNVDRLDKACDAVVFAVGSMAKLGLNPQEITKALNIVMSANMAKLGCKKDEHGKLMKPDNFDELYAPEPKLKKLLESAGIIDE